MKATTLQKALPTSFNALVKLMVPHAIRDGVDYENVAEIVDRLAVRDHRTEGQEEYLQTLSQLIEAYDNEHHAISSSGIKGIKALKLLMDSHEMTASDLGRLLGNRALGSKILRGERELSKTHLRILADKFKVSPALFI